MHASPTTSRLGEYSLVRLLARGGMAEVFEARREGPHGFAKRVAIKRILPQLARDERFVEMFCDEARVQASLSHPNLVELVDFGEAEGELYIALEFVDGISCADLLEAVYARRQAVDPAVALHVAREVLRGLDYVHHACDAEGRALGLVHRDVAPNNILIGHSGQVKIADFGIVRGHGVVPRTAPGELKGKVGYVSPEQALGRAVDERSDLFAVGVLLAEMLIGRPLFPGKTELEVLTSLHQGDLSNLRVYGRRLPDQLHAILNRALALDARHRFESARAFADELDAVALDLDFETGSYGLVEYLSELGVLSLTSTVQPVAAATRPRDLLAQSGHPDVGGARANAAATFRVRWPSGSLYGPVALPTLLELVATGRFAPDATVSADGLTYHHPAMLPELARLAGRAPYRFSEAGTDGGVAEHRILANTLPGHLYGLVLKRRTGLVTAVDEPHQIRLYLRDGNVVFSSSTDPRHLLGSLLVDRGICSRERVEAALEYGWPRGMRLGQALVAQGVLAPEDVDALLGEQLLVRTTELCSWRRGTLRFTPNADAGEVATLPALPPLALLTRAVLEAYELEEVQRLLTPLWHTPLGRGRGADAVRAALGVDVRFAEALVLATRGSTLARLVNEAEGDSALIAARVKAVFLGVVTGALRAG